MVVNDVWETSDRFSMKVEDNRMADAGIHKGDYVIIKKVGRYREGDIVVVKLGNKLIIRQYFIAARRIRLECRNPDRQTMILDSDTPGFSILGSVVQVIKEI